MPQTVAVPSPVASIDRLTLAVDALRGADAAQIGLLTPFADDSE